jgi:hypothetical protein
MQKGRAGDICVLHRTSRVRGFGPHLSSSLLDPHIVIVRSSSAHDFQEILLIDWPTLGLSHETLEPISPHWLNFSIGLLKTYYSRRM